MDQRNAENLTVSSCPQPGQVNIKMPPAAALIFRGPNALACQDSPQALHWALVDSMPTFDFWPGGLPTVLRPTVVKTVSSKKKCSVSTDIASTSVCCIEKTATVEQL
ncbi:hypothetical protein ACOTDN_27130 [Achromobacter xylosoxidans]|uniref:hypothetical protein n=1 Tax=Alcaligenes xylosoxydans xylosoxydans TaxID=85698 RepID=UPI001187303D|nr:hypothetical protein [Achromobacter xylosoxidans]